MRQYFSLSLLYIVSIGVLPKLADSKFSRHNQLESYNFEQYLKESGKKYDNANEYERRAKLFNANLQEIKDHNKKSLSWKRGVNRFTDLSKDEIKTIFGGDKFALESSKSTEVSLLGSINGKFEPPSSLDWRIKAPGIISPVKDQGHCGSCWAFAAVATIESYLALNTGKLNELSPQELVSCMANEDHCGGQGGCKGATAELAFDYLATSGLTEIWEYGYLPTTYWDGINNSCLRTSQMLPSATGSGYTLLKRNDYDELIYAISTVGPLAVNVDASEWSSYESGVFTGCPQENVNINHVVQLVGYGTTSDGMDYWTIRNSWSPEWGEDGYIRIQRSSGYCGNDYHNSAGVGCDYDPKNVTVCGMCGVMYDASFPTDVKN
jgi:cathepsin L